MYVNVGNFWMLSTGFGEIVPAYQSFLICSALALKKTEVFLARPPVPPSSTDPYHLPLLAFLYHLGGPWRLAPPGCVITHPPYPHDHKQEEIACVLIIGWEEQKPIPHGLSQGDRTQRLGGALA